MYESRQVSILTYRWKMIREFGGNVFPHTLCVLGGLSLQGHHKRRGSLKVSDVKPQSVLHKHWI